MQISILNGIYTDNGPDFRTSYPVNMVPVPKNSGISTGYLRPGDGLVANGRAQASIEAASTGRTSAIGLWAQSWCRWPAMAL